MKNFHRYFWLATLVFCSSYRGWGNTISINCNFLSISNAICSTAQEGDTVLIGPGSCVMLSEIVINRGISFNVIGSGTNATTLISASGLQNVFSVVSNSTNTMTFGMMNWVGDVNNNWGFFSDGNAD